MSRLATLAFAYAACHGSPSSDHPDAGSPTADAQPTTMDLRIAAAQKVATTDPVCTSIAPFYWQIGDAQAPITDGSVTSTSSTTVYQADSLLDIASASKLIFGAYVVERYKDDLGAIDQRAMTLESGYVSLNYTSCVLAKTVDACLAIGHNGDHTVGADDHFDYDGGHFQHYASAGLGLGGDDDAALAAAFGAVLGDELGIAFSSPQLAAGVRITPDGYAKFLRKIISGGLAIRDHLGEASVCTLPASCPGAIYSPAPYAWHYSYGHWVEDDPAQHDDGAFSSPGAFGFYPWIDASKTYYGIVARKVISETAYKESAYCGRAIRAAFMTGAAM